MHGSELHLNRGPRGVKPSPPLPQPGLSPPPQMCITHLFAHPSTCAGMLYLHSRSPPIAHRDLKSANLLVDGQWHVKVRQLCCPCYQGMHLHLAYPVSARSRTLPRPLLPAR